MQMVCLRQSLPSNSASENRDVWRFELRHDLEPRKDRRKNALRNDELAVCLVRNFPKLQSAGAPLRMQ